VGKENVQASRTGAAAASATDAVKLADPAKALDQFQKAADQIEQQYPGALSAFQSYVSGGAKGALDQQTQAQLANLPVSSTATAALDELRGYLGLPSISPTAGLSTSVNGLINKLNTDPNASQFASQLSGIRDQLDQAEKITDPAQRETAKQQIQGQLQSFSSSLGPQYQDVATQLGSISNQFNAGYGKDATSAWSPEVVQAKLEANPAYQFRMQQGMKAIDRSAAARGNLLSGNTLAAAQEFGQGLASQEYNNQINRLQSAVQTQAPGINSQAGLLQGAGNYLNQTGQSQGAAAGDIGKSIANAGQQAYNLGGQGQLQASQNQSQIYNQTALTNAQLAQQANTSNAQLEQQANLANQQASGVSPGLLTQLLNKV
jgi:hypothetical protein